jgi:hypothetical protein
LLEEALLVTGAEQQSLPVLIDFMRCESGNFNEIIDVFTVVREERTVLN